MTGIEAPAFQTQFAVAAGCAYLMNLAQRWSKLPWITTHTTHINALVRAIMSGVATLGITLTWDSTAHTLTIGGLTLTTILLGLWHWFSQYAVQHGFGQLLNIAKPPVGGAAGDR